MTGSNIPTVTEEAAQASVKETAPALANRKLIRNATSNWRLSALIMLSRRSLHLRTKNTGTLLRQIPRSRQMEN